MAEEFTVYKNNSKLLLYLGTSLALLWAANGLILFPFYLVLVSEASLVVCIGCLMSQQLLDHSIIPAAKKESLSMTDVYQLPLLGSLMLYGLYLAVKYLDKDLVNSLFMLYFSVAGVAAVAKTLCMFAALALPNQKPVITYQTTLKLVGELDLQWSVLDLCCFAVSVIIGAGYCATKHFLLNNLLGICFCIQGISQVSIGAFKIGALLLIGLFFYDIFWVFGTEVMEKVATSIDGPIKLLFPTSWITEELPKGKFSLLGLGDLVVPGLFLGLVTRYDAVRAKVDPKLVLTSVFPRPYFMSGVVGYVLGLSAAMVVMIVFKAGQPALLYLVPSCLLSTLITAFVLGDITGLMGYDEEEANKQVAEEKKKD